MYREREIVKADPKQTFRENLNLLRDYAYKLLVEEDKTVTSLEEFKEECGKEFLELGLAFGLTYRDLMVLLFKGILDQEKSNA
ncbi:MAG TPA: hypothetical protein VGA53_03055 [Candidatus Paceibacterota bacterium]